MEFFEAIKIALQSLWANKLRSVLTLIGVVIGATGMYLLEPGTPGREHRAQVAKLAS